MGEVERVELELDPLEEHAEPGVGVLFGENDVATVVGNEGRDLGYQAALVGAGEEEDRSSHSSAGVRLRDQDRRASSPGSGSALSSVVDMRRKQDDELLAMINHRLGLLDQISHRTGLIENVNARLEALTERLDSAAIDREAMQALTLTLRDIAAALADRLEATEARLQATEQRLEEVARAVAEQLQPRG